MIKFKIKEEDIFTKETEIRDCTLREKLEDIWFNLTLPLYRYKHFYYEHLSRFRERVKKLFIYAPIIWYDLDWDHSSLYTLLKFKLELMEKEFTKNPHTVCAPRHVKNMRICIHLLDRLIKDRYFDEAHDNLDRRFGNLVWKKLSKDDRGTSYELYREKEKHREKRYKLAFKKEFGKAAAQKKHDLELIFKIMERHIEQWWT